MIRPKKHLERIICPVCECEGEFELWDSIDVDLDPEQRERVLNDEIFTWICPKCGNSVFIPCGMLYHDKKHKFILDYSYSEQHNPGFVRNRPFEILDHVDLNEYKIRSVYGRDCFREKILILENGLDDVAVERMKYMILNYLRPELGDAGCELLFCNCSDKPCEHSEYGEIFFMYREADSSIKGFLGFGMDLYYDECLAVKVDPRLKVGHWAFVDQKWMVWVFRGRFFPVVDGSSASVHIGDHAEYKDGRWALVDSLGHALTEYKYFFVEPCGEGYFRVRVSGGCKYNLLRPDGSEIFTNSFPHISNVVKGFAIYTLTIRKTKTTPTQYLSGFISVKGDVIYPPLFNIIKPYDKEHQLTYYAELAKKPYVIAIDSGLYNPQKEHYPKKEKIDLKKFFEKLANWILPGLQFFYRDTDFPVTPGITYHVGEILRAGIFIDVTAKLLRPAQCTRFIIASAHTATFCEDPYNKQAQEWGLNVLHFNSYFKVMDIYEKDGFTQVFLLHIPYTAARIMATTNVDMHFHDQESGSMQTLVEMARVSLDEKLTMEVHHLSMDREWKARTEDLVGLDRNYYPIPFDPVPDSEVPENEVLSQQVHKLARDGDITDITTPVDNYEWNGAKSTVCAGCIYSNGIPDDASGCGRLFKESFRDRVVKGSCEYRKINIHIPSEFESSEKYRHEQEMLMQEKQSGIFSTNLLKDFIAEHLDGKITNLKTFDFSSLSNNSKFGCNSGNFDPKRSSIMRAIMALAFSDIWPELTYESIEKHKYELFTITNTQHSLGSFIYVSDANAGYYKSLNEYNPSEELNKRSKNLFRKTLSIGNIMVMPGKISDSKSHGYMDIFLANLRLAMMSDKQCDVTLRGSLFANRKLMKTYQGEQGFLKLVSAQMLEDFLDPDGLPEEKFDHVCGYDKKLARDRYLTALDCYITFSEQMIDNRASRIIAKLKAVLSS